MIHVISFRAYSLHLHRAVIDAHRIKKGRGLSAHQFLTLLSPVPTHHLFLVYTRAKSVGYE